MARDYYETLGVARTATEDQIKSAYRKLARQYHPDRNPGDKEAAAKFKDIQQAYDVLSEPAKRKQYDQFGPDFERMAAAGAGGAGGAGFGGNGPFTFNFGGGGPGAGGMDPDMMQSIFEQMFGGGGPAPRAGRARGRRSRAAAPPQDVEQAISIDFLTAVHGGALEAQTLEGKQVTIKIPAGIDDGKTLRVRGQGVNGGDLLVRVHVGPHPYFRRDGHDILLDLPLTIGEAVLGAKVDVPTLDGVVTLRVPPGTSSGQHLRVRGKGVPKPDGGRGDQLVEVKVVVPKSVDDKSRDLIQEFARRNPHEPRAGLGWRL
jgi:DnaJ-class molecular chaperone